MEIVENVHGTCRLPYTLLKDGKEKESGYLLSSKDVCTLDMIPELINSGVKSFKIEGRMKSKEYVGIVTSIYRKYIDLAESDKEYKVDNIDQLLDKIDKYNIPCWNKLPMDTANIKLDEPIKTLTFSYNKDNNTMYYNIDYNMMIEPFGRDILNNFVKEFLLLKKKENLIKEYTKNNE